jgi:hypothetical protein
VKEAAGSTSSRLTLRWYWRRTTAPATGGGPAMMMTLMAVLVTWALRAGRRRVTLAARGAWAVAWARSRSERPLACRRSLARRDGQRRKDGDAGDARGARAAVWARSGSTRPWVPLMRRATWVAYPLMQAVPGARGPAPHPY